MRACTLGPQKQNNTLKTIIMKEKLIYQAPDLEQVEVRTEVNFLTSGEFTVGVYTTDNNGTWDDDE